MTHEYLSTTTLGCLRDTQPCREGWAKLLAHLGKTKADDESLPLLTILDINGLGDALRCLDEDPELDRLKRHFQAWCAEQLLALFEAESPGDMRVRDQIAMLRRDDASDADRDAARSAARAAAWAAAGAAARSAARAAAWAAVSDAARAAAWAAAWAAAGDAAGAAVGDAAWAAARAAQEKQLRAMMEKKQ